ncbi:MAG: N-acetyltransferase, partial [Bacteroidia bacterium]
MKITIRKAISAEAETIISFQRLMARETEGMELSYDIISSGVKAVFEDPGKGTYFVAEEKGIIVGSFLITPEWSDWRNCYIWWFQSVYVLTEHRRKGIFRLMYDTTRELAVQNGAGGLRLYV